MTHFKINFVSYVSADFLEEGTNVVFNENIRPENGESNTGWFGGLNVDTDSIEISGTHGTFGNLIQCLDPAQHTLNGTN